ncbi:MAG: patatin-like phospholipase family protein [Actinomycetota bacterium]
MPTSRPVLTPLPRPIGFVLGGGGALGAVQVGMLRALLERGITPDLVVGTSIGAFNGAILAADPTSAVDKLINFWTKTSHINPVRWRGVTPLLRWRRTRLSLFANDALAFNIRSQLSGFHLIEDLALPFGAVAVDLHRGVPELFTDGELESALLASSAIPGLFPPVHRNQRFYYDGGLADNVPIRHAVAMGARSLVVLDTTNPYVSLDRPNSVSSLAAYVTEVYSRQTVLRYLTDFAEIPMLYPRSPASGTMSALDLSRTGTLLQQSYHDTVAYLERVLESA